MTVYQVFAAALRDGVQVGSIRTDHEAHNTGEVVEHFTAWVKKTWPDATPAITITEVIHHGT